MSRTNSMIRTARVAGILMFTGLGLSAFAQQEQRDLTLDDMLSVETLESGVVDPAGKWFFYERTRPYSQNKDYSFRTYAFQKSGHQIWQYNLETSDTPRLLEGLDPLPHSYLLGFSPGGDFLALMQYDFGELSILTYDMSRKLATKLGPAPAFSRTGEHNPVWISESELIYAALPDGTYPPGTSIRTVVGDATSRAWQNAWEGSEPTAFAVETPDESERPALQPGRLVRANAGTGETETLADGLYADLRLSPQRNLLVALAVSERRRPYSGQLVESETTQYSLALFDLESRERTNLAPSLSFAPYSIVWSADGSRVAAYGWEQGGDAREGRFYVVDVNSGAIDHYNHAGLQLTSERERGWKQRPERAVFLGDDLAVFARRIPADKKRAPQFAFQDIFPTGLPRADWYKLSMDSEPKNLSGSLSKVSAVPIHAGEQHLTIMASDGVFRVYVDGAISRLTDPALGSFQYLPPGNMATRGSVIRPEFADHALFHVSHASGSTIVLLDLLKDRDAEVVRYALPTERAEPVAGSVKGRALMYRVQVGLQDVLYATQASDSDNRVEIARINQHLENVRLPAWRKIAYEVSPPNSEGEARSIESCVLLPQGFSEGDPPPPLIVDIYPDARPNCDERDPRITYPDLDSPYLWAARGYAYSKLTAPRDLIRTEDGPIAGLDEIIDAGVDAVVSRKWANSEKLVLHGYSQGGAASLYVASQTNRYKAVVSRFGWANFVSHYFGGGGVYAQAFERYFGAEFTRYDSAIGTDFGIGRTPFEDPEAYSRNSPVLLADHIDIPVMLIHSDMDSFSKSEYDQMYGALLRAGKKALYVWYLGEGHGPSSPANVRDMWSRIATFLSEVDVAPDPSSDY